MGEWFEYDATDNTIMQMFAKIVIAFVEKCGDEIMVDFESQRKKYKITIEAKKKEDEIC